MIDLPGATARAAWRAWRRGDVGEVEHLAAHAGPRQRARLLFHASYVRGRYEQALVHYAAIRARRLEFTDLDGPVVNAWLHLGRPAAATAHLRRRRRPMTPDLRLRVERPLRTNLALTTALPFADQPLAPFLPAVTATLDGQRLCVHIDTGGTFLVMGTQRAQALGIPLVANGRGHHGTVGADLYTGMARELTLGDATLTNVPVAALPTLRGAQDVVIIGTNVLQQFLTTVDHPGQRVLLSPRRDPRAAAAHLALLEHQPEVARIPFYLWGGHYMFARGGLGARRDLNFFVDTGLVYVIQEGDSPHRQACLYATARQYRSLGVSRARAVGPHFHPDEPVSLGPLHQDDHLVATAPTRRVPWASFGGVRIDGMLTLAFLNRYAWTLDFDRHEYTFRHPTGTP